jgi:spore coat protein CotH
MGTSCGSPSGSAGAGDATPAGDDAGPSVDAGPTPTDEELETAEGCPGVFNPGQLLDYELSMSNSDWQTVLSDTSNSVYVPATMLCGSTSIEVGVRRKRSGEIAKPGLKIDINQFTPGQEYFGLRKLSLESGIGEGGTQGSVESVLSEYLAWRLVQLSGTMGSRASLIRLTVNGEVLGVYVNVEQPDKRFLQSRLGHKDGWLWKKSGSPRDGQKTNEGIDDPFDDFFCFFAKNGCAMPSAQVLLADLPTKMDIDQFLRVGAINAIMGNSDAPLFKDNNYLYYDYELGRVYFPWDLDTVMRADVDVVTGGVGGQVDFYTDAMYSNWQADYLAVVADMVENKIPLAVVTQEIEAIVSSAGTALEADTFLDGTATGAGTALSDWWTSRFSQVSEDLTQ